MDRVISTSNRGSGIAISGTGRVAVKDSSVFTNALDGVNVEVQAGSVSLIEVLGASNSRQAFRFAKSRTVTFEFSIAVRFSEM